LFGNTRDCLRVEAEIKSFLAKMEKDSVKIEDPGKLLSANDLDQLRKKFGETLAIVAGKKNIKLYSLDS